MKNLFTLAIAAIFSMASLAQNKEGSIVYTMNIDGLPPEAAAMMQGMETRIFVKGDKTKSEVVNPFSTTISISDNKTKDVVTLMDIMGQKYMIKSKIEEPTTDKNGKPEIKIKKLNDSKTIAGYKCKNAEVSVKDKKSRESHTSIVWYTTEAGLGYEASFNGLGGLPLEYEMKRDGRKIQMSCKSVSFDKVPDSTFDIPEGYTETTQAELEQMFKGMGK
jgi:GLPGLI family protein